MHPTSEHLNMSRKLTELGGEIDSNTVKDFSSPPSITEPPDKMSTLLRLFRDIYSSI